MEKDKRLRSLDALRGFDMLFIMGLASLIVAVCELVPGGDECWLAQQMHHVAWNGLAHHDTIFPLFLFMAGVSFPFSLAKQQENGRTQGQVVRKIVVRGLMLVLLGLVYNGLFNLDFANLRCASVLARIGLAWMFAALLFLNFGWRVRAIFSAVVLIGYYLLVRFVAAPDMPAGTDPLSMEGNMVGFIDRILLPGRLIYCDGRFDPEGLLSLLPAIVTALLGMFAGELVRKPADKCSGNQKTMYMMLAAVVMLVVGLVWSMDFPINKMLWNSTFVLVVGAYSVFCFALFYWIIDVKGWKSWTLFFEVVGMNSITIYMAQRIVNFGGINKFFLGGLADLCGPECGKVVLAAGYVAVCWLFLYFLYKKKVFLKV